MTTKVTNAIKPKSQQVLVAARGPNRKLGFRAARLVASLLLGLAAWAAAAHADPRLVPSIGQVIHRAVGYEQAGALYADVTASVLRVLVGFFVGSALGIAVGLAIGWYRWIHDLVHPWIQFLRMIPPLALLPLLVIYLGIGETAKYTVIAFAVFLTVVIATSEGVTSSPPVLVKAARTLGANDLQLFKTVVLPGSIPYILVGLRLGLAAGWTTVVAAEIIGASSGLGYRVELSGLNFDLPTAYVSIILIGIIGIIMDTLLTFFERKVTPWQDRKGK